MVDVIRTCISEICERIDYWAAEGDLTESELGYILAQVSDLYECEEDDEDMELWGEQEE